MRRKVFKISVAYVSPYSNSVNRYTKITIDDLRSTGLSVYSLKEAFKSHWFIPRSSKLLVLNWFEDRIAASNRPIFEFTRSLLVLLLLKLRVRHVIWMRHNLFPHDSSYRSLLDRVFLFALARVTSATVTLRPSCLSTYVIPHPTYRQQQQSVLSESERRDEYILFGSVRRNKGYDILLSWWPPNRRLVILGKCSDPELTQELTKTIETRCLDVEWQNLFVPDHELDARLAKAKYAVVAHQDGTSIVSGTFYHAASFGLNVLITPGDFFDHLKKTYSFAHLLNLENLSLRPYVAPETVVEEIDRVNGAQARLAAWINASSSMGLQLPVPLVLQSDSGVRQSCS